MANTVALESAAKEREVDKLVPKGRRLPFSQISGYHVAGGTAKSILNHKTQLIGADLIDAVSGDMGEVYDRLMEISLGNAS